MAEEDLTSSAMTPLAWEIVSNVRVVRSADRMDYQHTAVTSHLDISIQGKMTEDMSVTIRAVPDQYYSLYSGGTSGGSSGGTALSVVEQSEGMENIYTISGDTLTITASNMRHLFPFEKIKYMKDWKEYEVENVFPDEITDFDFIVEWMPSKTSMWGGYVTISAGAYDAGGISMTIYFSVTNQYEVWTREFFDAAAEKSASFIAELEEDSEIDDARGQDPVMEVDNDDYTEITEDMFTDSVNDLDLDGDAMTGYVNRPIDANLDEILRDLEINNAGDATNADENGITILSRSNNVIDNATMEKIDKVLGLLDDGEVKIPRISRNKEDRLRRAQDALRNSEYKVPKEIITSVYDNIRHDKTFVEKLESIEEDMKKGNRAAITTKSNEIIRDATLSNNKIQEIEIYLEEIDKNNNFDGALKIINDIVRRINANVMYLPDLEVSMSAMQIGDTQKALKYITDILDGEDRYYDNIPNPKIANIPEDEKEYMNPKVHSKDTLNEWFEKFIEGKK